MVWRTEPRYERAVLTQNDRKLYRSLQEKKPRGMAKRFLAQGRKVVAEAIASSFRLEVILATEEAAEFVKPLVEKRGDRSLRVEIQPEHELDRIGTFEKGNELIAIVHEPPPTAFRAPGSDELMLALDGVRDPRNLGSLLRIADWFGVRRLLISHDSMDTYNPKVVQSAMGSLFRVETRRVNIGSELAALTAEGTHVLLADMDGTSVYEAALPRPTVLVLGSESHGHSRAVEELGARVISIPRLGGAESLNVAMAAAALCTELCRPR